MSEAPSQQGGGGGRVGRGGGGGRARGGGRGRGRGRGGGRGRGDGSDNAESGDKGAPNKNTSNKGPKIQKDGVVGGRGNKNRGRNPKGKGKDTKPEEPKISEEEKLRLEEELKQKEAAEAERKRLEQEQKALEKAQAEHQKALEQLETRVREATDYLKNTIEATKGHANSRESLTPDELSKQRKSFEASKKSLKSDLKKCTAFVKKIKTGGAWSMKPADITRELSTLNLSRYVEEVVSSLCEAKLKITDMSVVIALCTAMHVRYPEFLNNLLYALWSVIHGKSTEDTAKLRRIYVRLITEFVQNGLLTETKALVKLITETTGGKDGNYNVTDANIVVAFAKSAGFEIFGITPKSITQFSTLIRQEVERQEQSEKESSSEVPVAYDDADEKPKEESVVISSKLAKEAMDYLQQMDELLDQRAVISDISETLVIHCKGAHRTLSNSLVTTHGKLQKLVKRCDQDRLLSGTLTDAREKGLSDARKLLESLQKSVEALSDALDQPMPQLEEEENEDAEGGGTGIELWTKGGDEEGGDYGPFDDEETRAFYSDIPDLLTTVPPALLNMSLEEIEKRKANNLVRFGAGVETAVVDGENEEAEVEASSEAQLEAAEQEETLASSKEGEDNEEGKEENKDTPHYKLMVLLEQELPECSRREQIDEISETFCTNHGTSKNSRKRLAQTLFHVPRTRLDLLPYYSRMTATLTRVWPDVSASLVTDLEQQFHGQAKYKKNQNIESRLRTARYLGELTKFGVAPPMVAFRCLRRCLDDFTGGNVDVACCLLEACGRYLYRLPHTNPKLTLLMEAMMRLSKAKHLDERSQAMIKTAFFTVKPPASGPRKQAKVYPPLEGYLRHLLMVKMEPTESSIGFVSKQLIRCPWADPSQQCGQLICKIMLKTCRKGRYRAIHAIAAVAAKLRRHKPEVCIRLIDASLEELQWSLEHPAFKDQQRTITYARLLGELYCSSLASGQLVIQQLYTFIDFGHDIPEALRQASEKQQSMSTNGGAAEGEQLNVPNSATGISQTIQEDEEMDESELATKEDTAPAELVPVAVSRYSKHDPRVPSFLDPPSSVFRIKLVCTLLEVVGRTIVTRNNFPKIEGFLAAFQRYLFTKTMLPAEVEFALLDTFDIIDSQWKKVTKDVGRSKKNDGTASQSQGFPRYVSWLEAHNATVAVEEAEAIFDNKGRARLEHVARDTKPDGDDTVCSDLLHDEDDDDMMEDDDDSTEDALSVSAKDSLADDHSDQLSGDEDGMEVDEESQSGDEDEEDDSEDDDEDDSDDEGSEEEFDEQAYMQQLEDEAFERELRRLTMDALDKGKAMARGGKVSEHMPTGSQFIKKKPTETAAEGPAMALGGKEGISFQLLKKGNKGKLESKQFVVPTDTNLALVATKQDDEAARERDMIKARVLQYEAESAEAGPGGNVYLEQAKLQVIRNRPLSMDEIDRNFGTTGGSLRTNDKSKSGQAGRGGSSGTDSFGGRGRGGSFGGRGLGGGRGGGRGRGGRGSSSGRTLV